MKILLVDQFRGPSPYEISKHPCTFDGLCNEVLARGETDYRRAKVLEVDESFIQPDCTTAWRADANGMAECWRYSWDSSG